MGCTNSSYHIPPAVVNAASSSHGTLEAAVVPLYGISQSYLRDLVQSHSDASKWTVSEFCDRVVKPMTSKRKCSLAEELLASTKTKSFIKPVADVFISYAWRYTMGDFLDCLEGPQKSVTAPDRFIWVDFAIINQHTSGDVHQEQWLETFSGALKQIGKAELLLMPWQKPIPVERSWCVFEQYVITSQKLPFTPKMLPRDAEEVRTMLRRGKFMFKTFLKTFASIDCEKSTAFKQDDQAHILGLLRSKKAVRTTNDATMLSIKTFLVKVAVEEAEAANKLEMQTIECGNVYHGVGILLDALGDFSKALPWYEKSVTVRRTFEESSKNSGDLAASLTDLGACLMKLDRISEADTVFKESYTIKQLVLGEDHPDTIKSKGWLATVLYRQKKLTEALPLFESVVQANIRILGSEHENTARSVNNLAACYRDLGQTEKALDNYELATAITRKTLGDSHPDLAVCLNNVAVCYDTLNQLEKAIEYYTQAVEIQKKALGDSHQNVGIASHNLAMSLKALGHESKAKEYGQEALRIFTKSFGANHSNTKMAREMWGEA